MSQNPPEATTQVIPPNIRQMPDGRLLLVGGNHNVLTMFGSDASPVSPAQVAVVLDNHARRSAWCAERGTGFGQWIFPDPIVFAGGFPDGTVASVVERALPQAIRPAALYYPRAVIHGHPDRQSRTDTHYSPIGTLHLSAEVARRTLGLDPSEQVARLLAGLSPPAPYTGDLGVQCTPPVSETRAR